MLVLFRFPILATIAGLAVAGILGGPAIMGVVAILVVLEISLSFDNAVVNATVLKRMDERWQRIFLTVGVLIAVFGMRLIFPIVVVAIAGHLSPVNAVHLAISHPHEYALQLKAAHPAIAAFGGTFLLMIFLDFIFEEREITWLTWIERPLAKVGRLDQLSAILALVLLVVAASTFAHPHAYQVLIAGASGLATYIGVASISSLFEAEEEGDDDDEDALAVKLPAQVARAGLVTFLYLELIDASFSFDGVVGAFAVTDKIFVIALGLGIGASYIRALTVYLVRKGTLDEYIHLEAGAHWAIGALAALLFISIRHDIRQIITGLIGVAFIGLALITSIIHRRNEAKAVSPPDPVTS